uniref:Uncharacterized protein n=1 Tax=Aegilops tauschii subsp. strangulata TaxID=200361 RepID=A0A453SET0_AEGTS
DHPRPPQRPPLLSSPYLLLTIGNLLPSPSHQIEQQAGIRSSLRSGTPKAMVSVENAMDKVLWPGCCSHGQGALPISLFSLCWVRIGSKVLHVVLYPMYALLIYIY